jgi:hypothetical protein
MTAFTLIHSGGFRFLFCRTWRTQSILADAQCPVQSIVLAIMIHCLLISIFRKNRFRFSVCPGDSDLRETA